MQLSGPKSPESPESPVDRSSFIAATVVEMFLEDIERSADDCLSQSAEFAVFPDIGVVIFPDVAVREAPAEIGEPMLAQQAPGVTLLRPDPRFVQVVWMPPGQLVGFLDDEDLRTGAV